MSVTRRRRLRGVAVTTAIAAGLATALSTVPAAQAGPSTVLPSPLAAQSLGVPSEGSAGSVRIENSFVSSQGWVKPDSGVAEEGKDGKYPSRIILTNDGGTDAPATVQLSAPVGTTFLDARGPGSRTLSARSISWTVTVPAGQTSTLVVEHQADTLAETPTLVWRDLSTTAVLTVGGVSAAPVLSHGPKVIPPGEAYDTAKYGDRPFPVVPVQYTDRSYQAGNSGDELEAVINDPAKPGSTFNLFQEMSLGQLYPEGTVGSAGIATEDFTYGPGFEFSHVQPGQTCTGGLTFGDSPASVQGTALYPTRITDGVYNLPGNTAYYGADANGSALVGAVAGVGALQQIDGGCGSPGKLVYDAAAIADPEIDYSDYDTDKDGVVDFFMAVFAGCGGNGSSQLSVAGCDYTDAPYDNVWPHSSSLEFYYSDPVTGLPGYTTDDQLKDLEGRPLWYTDDTYSQKTTVDKGDALKVLVRVGPYNVNPETAIDKASVISHEYGHSLGLPDFYSTGSRETYGDWNLMATDKSQNMDVFSRQELGWVVPTVLQPGQTRQVDGWTDSKQDTDAIAWQTADGTPYTLREGQDGVQRVQNSEAYVAKLPGRQLLDPAKFDTGDKASKTHAWWSGSGNDFGCAPTGGRNLDLSIPELATVDPDSTVTLEMKSLWDIEWDYDYGFVMTTTDGGDTYTSHASDNGYTTSNTDPTAGNPNQNACQTQYDNGLTGTSGSYSDGTEVLDRKAGNTPPAVFLSDSFDISDLAGEAEGALRFSYATDPGLARPGWFIDDVKVTVTEPGGTPRQVLVTDFESSGGPSDDRVFNGGCREDLTTASRCTPGWQYLAAGAEAPADHAYYLEMRDRSGFDLDGKGQIDRDPIGFAAGLSMVYTDEAHGYGNAGVDDPPAQSPLDSQPDPGSATPDLNDAAWTAAAGDSSFTDSGVGHVDNYTTPTTNDKGEPSGDGLWHLQYDCLTFDVTRMTGNDDGPATSDGDLTGDVLFDLGTGCGRFDYGYTPATTSPSGTGGDTGDSASGGTAAGAASGSAPTARAKANPRRVKVKDTVRFTGAASTDPDDPKRLSYSWDFGNGGSTQDATGVDVSHRFTRAGIYDVRLTVTDPQGHNAVSTVTVRVSKQWDCGNERIDRGGSWRVTARPQARGGHACDSRGGSGALSARFTGQRLAFVYGKARDGGRATVLVDGEKVGVLRFQSDSARPQYRYRRSFGGLGGGSHTVRVVLTKGAGHIDDLVLFGRLLR
ncbi:PKD domain-containing protein [Nocardioides iriomotensis]|uniref:PKD domain-containing protein n=1 Tax=Nocardioides iriomotensis TaxID=715784 RepID=A0A4Q5IXW8_9ACTN|nr:PKD domain-containing protein [Nocardioides iriomotensis]RYU09831.1 PKD domain-containing protein [Nocardioides iriomotensis]